MLLNLLQDLSSEDNHRGCSISNLGVLRTGDVCEDAGCWVDDI